MEFNENHLLAVVHNPEQEEAEEHIAIDYTGEDFSIGFNVGYLVDALNAVKEKYENAKSNKNPSEQ